MRPYKDDEEALRDVLRLSRAMTYKAAIMNLPQGGGKCVLFGDPSKDKNKEFFNEVGRIIDSLKGAYLGAENSGTSIQDMKWIHETTKFVTGWTKYGDPSPVTALGVFQGIATYLEVILNKRKLEGVRVAIQGVGNVGYELGKQLFKCGAKLIICDTNKKRLEKAQKEFHAQVVDPQEIFNQEVDVFSPCAYGGVLKPDIISKLRCQIVAGGANNQFADEIEDPKRLHERGIWQAPDYVINAGGIINLYCEYHQERDQLMPRMAVIPKRLREILEITKEDNKPPLAIADEIVDKKLKS